MTASSRIPERHVCVDGHVTRLPGRRQAIGRQVCPPVRPSDPELTETVRHTTQPYFLLEGNGCAVLAAKVHLDPHMPDGEIASNPESIIPSVRASKTAGAIAFQQGAQTHAGLLTAMVEPVAANSRASGWTKHKQLLGQRDVGL